MSRDIKNGFDEWGGYMEAKVAKLEEQFSNASNIFQQTNLFAGISVFVNGLTNPSANEIKRIMMVNGGIFHHYERSHTMYIIASNLPDVKVRKMNTNKIIKPQWIIDCVQENRILDYTPYLLYTNQNALQPCLQFNNSQKESKTNTFAGSNIELTSSKMNMEKFCVDNDFTEKSQLHEYNNINLNKKLAKTNTGEEAHNALHPKFLSEFYNNSRLHHISTLGNGFKQYISNLRENYNCKDFPARNRLKMKILNEKKPKPKEKLIQCVMHIDMDCFFVSVGLRKYPHLSGHAVAVTHSKGGSSATVVPIHPNANRNIESNLLVKRFEQHLHNDVLSDKVRNGFNSKMSLSEIASCSYEARAKGIRNGMFVGQALKLCPELKTIPYDFKAYKEVAFKLYDIIAQYTLNIEAVSCDEMFVDLVDVLNEMEVTPIDFVQAVRKEVREKTGCTCSAGVGANKLQARIATKFAKPNGQFCMEVYDVERFMADISIRDLVGVGCSTAYTLEKANLLTCGDLQKVSLRTIQMHVGKKFGETLHQFCRGVDHRLLIYEQIRKSVSAEVNYGIRFTEFVELNKFLRQLCIEVHSRLIAINRKTKCITLKLMVRAKDAPIETSKFMGHGVCDNITKSVSLSVYTNDVDKITRTVVTTMKSLSISPKELRGIGIQLSKLDDLSEVSSPKKNLIKNMFTKASKKGIKTNDIVEQKNFMKLMLAWTKRCTKPKAQDIERISVQALEFVRTKKIDILYVSLTYLQRLINKKKKDDFDCSWYFAFKTIIDKVNVEMNDVYEGKYIFLGTYFN